MGTVEQKVLSMIVELEIVEFMQELIRAKSPYPPGDTREVADVCLRKLNEAGIGAELLYPGPEVKSKFDDGVKNNHIPSVLGILNGTQEKPVLLLNAHIDTVSVEDPEKWKHNPFSGAIEEGYIYGRGAGDDKGSVCAQVMATVALARAGVKLNGTLLVNPVADEEASAYRGTQWLLEAGYYKPTPDYLIIGEQTDNRLSVAERAELWVEVTIKGQAAHGAMPWEGDNAIVRASRFITLIDIDLAPRLKARTHPYLPHSTVNVSKIHAGINRNAVPEICKIFIDRRYIPGENRESIIKELEELLNKLAEETTPFEWEIEVITDPGSPVDTDPEEPLVKTMLNVIEEVSGEKAEPTGYRQGSDGKYFPKLGIPIVHYGPSDPAVGHATNERVSIEQLVEATKVYALSALRILGHS